jgi:hypothetical protein
MSRPVDPRPGLSTGRPAGASPARFSRHADPRESGQPLEPGFRSPAGTPLAAPRATVAALGRGLRAADDGGRRNGSGPAVGRPWRRHAAAQPIWRAVGLGRRLPAAARGPATGATTVRASADSVRGRSSGRRPRCSGRCLGASRRCGPGHVRRAGGWSWRRRDRPSGRRAHRVRAGCALRDPGASHRAGRTDRTAGWPARSMAARTLPALGRSAARSVSGSARPAVPTRPGPAAAVAAVSGRQVVGGAARPPHRVPRARADRSSGPRMGLAVRAQQPISRHMGVDLRRRQARVPQQLLYDAQVGTAIE